MMFKEKEEMASAEIIPIMAENNDSPLESKDDDTLPLLPLRNMILFPNVIQPIAIGRKKSLRLIREVFQQGGEFLACTQKDSNVESPKLSDIHPLGTIASIIRILEMPDGTTTAIVRGKCRAQAMEIVDSSPYYTARIALQPETEPEENDRMYQALVEALKEIAVKIVKISDIIPDEVTFALKNIDRPNELINYISNNFNMALEEKVNLINMNDIAERGYKLIELLTKEVQMLEIKARIQKKARTEMNEQQREFFLQQQMRTIQEELGDMGNNEIEELKRKAEEKKWNAETEEIFTKELRKLERIHPATPDYNVQLTYLETLLNLPWNEFTKDNKDIKRAQRVLDSDHFGLKKVKERIIEHLAVLKLRGDLKSPIICLYGPPGVGKTSLGKSIAKALGRNYLRVSLGGVHDESEIRGHRRTYIGAMPGRIIQSIRKAGSSNPLFVLDEIDKMTISNHGDPSSALLEVLDPEQNNAFHDNYIDVDYDLSNVIFIATANDIGAIPRPLLDRMELIEVNGYITEEKIEIASRHLIPKQLEIHGVNEAQIKFTRPAIKTIIENYTRESGVRTLERQIAKIIRKVAINIAVDENHTANIKPQDVINYLGVSHINHDVYKNCDTPGVVTGLAWTQVGGEILYIETSVNPQKGGKLSVTGNLGDVMKESAQLAMEYIKSHTAELGIDNEAIESHSFHVHVPEGATPKDGPSAGITILTSLVSSITQRKVKSHLAMTGEITLRGKLLPVGGIKEKILAAKRAGIKEIILCSENRKDIEEIEASYLKGLEFHFCDDMRQVLKIALV